jgi:polyisoprenoid-binding protein YceI
MPERGLTRLPATVAALALAAGLSVGAAPARAAPAVYALDPAHSFVHFGVLHFGTSTLWGRFRARWSSIPRPAAATWG